VSTSVYIDRIFIDSSAVIPIVFAYPLALRKRDKNRILYAGLAVVMAFVTALSGWGYVRYQQKEDWRGASSALMNIQEENRLVVFDALAGEALFDYYAQGFAQPNSHISTTGVPISYHDQSPTPAVTPIASESDFSRLRASVESGKFSEIDLVSSHTSYSDPNDLVENYLNRVFTRRAEQQFYGIRIVRFLTPTY
jgi:hypothetical protein